MSKAAGGQGDPSFAPLLSGLLPAESVTLVPGDLRHAAVLVLLYPSLDDGEKAAPDQELEGLSLLLIERPATQRHHPGQVALPGGGAEPGDESIIATALREAKEEVGLDPQIVQVLGRLPEVRVSVSGFHVTPVVGWTASRPQFRPNATEIGRLLEMPLSRLMEPGYLREAPAPEGASVRTVYECDLEGVRVWGATARILFTLTNVIRAGDEQN